MLKSEAFLFCLQISVINSPICRLIYEPWYLPISLSITSLSLSSIFRVISRRFSSDVGLIGACELFPLLPLTSDDSGTVNILFCSSAEAVVASSASSGCDDAHTVIMINNVNTIDGSIFVCDDSFTRLTANVFFFYIFCLFHSNWKYLILQPYNVSRVNHYEALLSEQCIFFFLHFAWKNLNLIVFNGTETLFARFSHRIWLRFRDALLSELYRLLMTLLHGNQLS